MRAGKQSVNGALERALQGVRLLHVQRGLPLDGLLARGVKLLLCLPAEPVLIELLDPRESFFLRLELFFADQLGFVLDLECFNLEVEVPAKGLRSELRGFADILLLDGELLLLDCDFLLDAARGKFLRVEAAESR